MRKANERAHIVEGLIKAISVLDELIETIRKSANRSDAKANIIAKYSFTDVQADAILNLQLYRLTNTDITLLSEEKKELESKIEAYENILNHPEVLLKTIKQHLKQIKKSYTSLNVRRTVIEAEIETIKINIEVTVPNEKVVISLTNEGYIKRTSLRSYGASNLDDMMMKSSDYLVRLFEADTTDYLLVFTSLEIYSSLFMNYQIYAERIWGNHISNITSMDKGETIIQCIPVREFSDHQYLLFCTKQGMVKKTSLNLYKSNRYSRSLIAINLREKDEVIDVFLTNGKQDIFILIIWAMIWFNEEEISPIGLRAQGVIGMNLKSDDFVVNAQMFHDGADPDLVILTQRGACKRMRLDVFNKSARARRGQSMLRELKAKPHRVAGFLALQEQEKMRIITDNDKVIEAAPHGLPISDRNSNGSFILDPDDEGQITALIKELSMKTI